MSISSDTYSNFNFKIDFAAIEKERKVHCIENLLRYSAARKYIYAKRFFMK